MSSLHATARPVPLVLIAGLLSLAFVASLPAQTNLTIGVTGPASASVGISFTYSVTVTNAGLSTATGVTVTAILPPGFSFQSSGSGLPGLPCQGNGDTVMCPIGTLAAGASTPSPLPIKASASASAASPSTAVFGVIGNELDPDMSLNSFNFPINVLYPPRVDGIAPVSGSTAGGTSVTVSGANFAPGAVITLGGAAVTGVVFVSSTTLRGTTTPRAAGLVDVVVTNPNTLSGTLVGGFTYEAPPQVTFITPTWGPTAGGTVVTILGTNFQAGATVAIGAVTAIVTSVSPTSITATTRAHPPRSVSVVVTNLSGLSGTLAGQLFTYVAPTSPLVLQTLPQCRAVDTRLANGPYGGPALVVGASRTFLLRGRCGVPSYAKSVNLTASVIGPTGPGGLTLFPSDITDPATPLVHFRSGRNRSNNGFVNLDPSGNLTVKNQSAGTTHMTIDVSGFFATAPPQVTLATPLYGSTAGGTLVTVTGANFVSGATVSLGGSPLTGVTFINSSTLRGTTTAHAEGTVDVVVTNPDTQVGTKAAGFIYERPPQIISISPSWGPTAGGTAVTIDGTDFRPGATVTIGAAASVTSVTPTRIVATTAARAPQSVAVTVTNNPSGLAGTASQLFTYVAPAGPGLALITVTPCRAVDTRLANGPYGGPNLAAGSTRTFTMHGRCGIPTTAKAVSVTAVALAPAAAGHLILNQADIATPTTSTLNYRAGKDRANNLPVNLDASGRLNVTTLASTHLLLDVLGYFAVPPPPVTVTTVSPSAGRLAGGTAVVISGTNFAAGATVTFGGGAASGVSVPSATTIQATTPAHAAGAVEVVVTIPDGRSGVLPNGFSYVVPPSVTGISPTWGSTSGGTVVTISGSNFRAGATVAIGSSAASVTNVTASAITATTAAHPAQAANVTVTNNPDGQSATLGGLPFTYSEPVVAVRFYSLTQCRLVDTRGAAGPDGAPALSATVPRTFSVWGKCGVPSGARAVSISVKALAPTATGHLSLYPSHIAAPTSSVLNYIVGRDRSNSTPVRLDSSGRLTALATQASGTVHLIIDVEGYFQ